MDEWWDVGDPDLAYIGDRHELCIADDYPTVWRCGVCDRPVCVEGMSRHLTEVHQITYASYHEV
jgi:hypothetical protein